jgi:hypothetical protein
MLDILVPEEFGFRKGTSTENAAFKLTDSISKSINKKMHVGGIFCDVAKYFECIIHKIVSTKLLFWSNSKLVQILPNRE